MTHVRNDAIRSVGALSASVMLATLGLSPAAFAQPEAGGAAPAAEAPSTPSAAPSPAPDAPASPDAAAPAPSAPQGDTPAIVPNRFGGQIPRYVDPSQALKETLDKDGDDKGYFAAAPEGKVLPGGVMRVKIPMRFGNGDSGFDWDGNREDTGFEVSAFGTGAIIEYGVTDDLSIQVGIPYVARNRLGLDAATFRNSLVYKRQYERFERSAARLLVERRALCATEAACVQAIRNGAALPYDTTITLPTGEQLPVKAGVPIRQVADALVTNGALPQSGETGLGDIEVGALYSAINERGPLTGSPLFFSIGGGFRFPTGKFDDVPTSMRPTGRGTLDLGIRTNLDWNVLSGVFISWQNQMEVMLRKGERKLTSLLDNTRLNAADPTTAAARNAGSTAKGNNQEFERKGWRNVGFVKAAWGLGNLTQDLKILGVNTQWQYDYDAAESLDGVSQGPRRQVYAFSFGTTLDGLAYKVPAQLNVDYSIPYDGKNAPVAARVLTVELRGFYRF